MSMTRPQRKFKEFVPLINDNPKRKETKALTVDWHRESIIQSEISRETCGSISKVEVKVTKPAQHVNVYDSSWVRG